MTFAAGQGTVFSSQLESLVKDIPVPPPSQVKFREEIFSVTVAEVSLQEPVLIRHLKLFPFMSKANAFTVNVSSVTPE